MVLCKWFDAGTSSLEISFTSDSSVNDQGVKILAACVAINDQFANRLNWSQRHLTSSGDCSNGTVKPTVQNANTIIVPETVTTTTTTTRTTTLTTTTTTPLMVDFSVADHTIVDKFVVIEPFIAFESETLTKSAYCDEMSNVAIKFKEFDTTASLVLTTHNDSIIFSKTLLKEVFFLSFNSDITGNWHKNQIPLCKWLDTGSPAVKLELISAKETNFVGIFMVMACVEKKRYDVDFTSRYRWESRSLLDSGDCPKATCKSHSCLKLKL